MNSLELEKLNDYNRLFSVYCSGIEQHFENDIPDRDYVTGSLFTMQEMFDHLIKEFQASSEASHKLNASSKDTCNNLDCDDLSAEEYLVKIREVWSLYKSDKITFDKVNKMVSGYCKKYCDHPEIKLVHDVAESVELHKTLCKDCPASKILEEGRC